MINIQLVQPQDIQWGVKLASPLLDKGLVRQKVKDKYPLEWVQHQILTGAAQLWLVWRNNKLAAAVMTQIHTYPSGLQYIEIFLVGGSKLREWAITAYEMITEFGKSMGCSTLVAGGRLGWNKIAKLCNSNARTDSLVAIDLREVENA